MSTLDIISACKAGLKELISVISSDREISFKFGGKHITNNISIENLRQEFSELNDKEIADKLMDSYMKENYTKKSLYMNGVFLYTDSERSFSDIEVEKIQDVIFESEYEGNAGGRFLEKYLDEIDDIFSMGNALVINFSVCEYRHKYNEDGVIEFIDWLNKELYGDIEFTKFTIY